MGRALPATPLHHGKLAAALQEWDMGGLQVLGRGHKRRELLPRVQLGRRVTGEGSGRVDTWPWATRLLYNISLNLWICFITWVFFPPLWGILSPFYRGGT